jgi:CelD/BcsL family acetyltransferase involved in cellulose biosynthesis
MIVAPAAGGLRLHVLDTFDSTLIDAQRWNALLAASATDAVFLTHDWQRLWWDRFGDERLMLVLAEREGEPVALAPLFAVDGSVSLVGSGNSDHLDFLGRPDEALLAAMLEAARAAAPGFAAIELYHVPADSPTSALLPGVAARLGLEIHCEAALGAPYADLRDGELLARLTERRSIRKEQARMRRAGPLHLRRASGENLRALVELFLEQHGERWRAAGERSFDRAGSREFLRSVVLAGERDGWAQLTVLEWQDRPAAIDISLIRGDTQLSWLVSRDPSIREYSPGRVLRAHVVRAASRAGIRRFDFGLGEEDYKLRDASGVTAHHDWFLNP